MLKIRNVLILLGMLLSPMAAADVQVSIGINLPVYPQFVVVPGYPVYYAPQLEANYFFYDGMYWVYQDDNWYGSTWYNGPWWSVGPEYVPLYVLRIPVRYYRRPPMYFHGWRPDAPPRWGDHWGHDWEQRRSGWDRWDRHAVQAPAPLPVYQREYSGDRYPRQVEQQHEIQQQKYSHQPRDPVVREHYQKQEVRKTSTQQEEQRGASEDRGSRQQDQRGATEDKDSRQRDSSANPRAQSPQRNSQDVQKSTPSAPQQGRPQAQDRGQKSQPAADPSGQQAAGSQGREERQQGKDATQEPRRGQGKERGQDRNER